jgi:hypothetical protein
MWGAATSALRIRKERAGDRPLVASRLKLFACRRLPRGRRGREEKTKMIRKAILYTTFNKGLIRLGITVGLLALALASAAPGCPELDEGTKS